MLLFSWMKIKNHIYIFFSFFILSVSRISTLISSRRAFIDPLHDDIDLWMDTHTQSKKCFVEWKSKLVFQHTRHISSSTIDRYITRSIDIYIYIYICFDIYKSLCMSETMYNVKCISRDNWTFMVPCRPRTIQCRVLCVIARRQTSMATRIRGMDR